MTDIILKFLGRDIDDAAAVTGAGLRFQDGISLWLVAAGIMLLGVLSWYLYRKSPQRLSPGRRIALTGLRTAFFGVLLLTALRPVLSLGVERNVRQTLLTIIDDSGSMGIKDLRSAENDLKRSAIARGVLKANRGLKQRLPSNRDRRLDGLSRHEVLKSVLQNDALNPFPKLSEDFDMAYFRFSGDLEPLPSLKRMKSLAAEGNQTAMGSCVREAVRQFRGDVIAGILLVTDGASNAGSPPRDLIPFLQKEKVPLYIYGLGVRSPRDVELDGLNTPPAVLAGDPVAASVTLRSRGYSDQSATLVIKLDDEEISRQPIVLGGDGVQEIPITFTPERTGEFQLEAFIAPLAGEAIKDNNTLSHPLRVEDARIRVLMVEQAPRWEFKYLLAILLREKRVDLDCYLVEASKTVARIPGSPFLEEFPARREDLFAYDLIIFGDLDPKLFTPAQLDDFSDFVSEAGGAFVMLAGKRFSPRAYRHTVMENLLPVELPPQGLPTAQLKEAGTPVHPRLTLLGMQSPMLRLAEEDEKNDAVWRELPAFYWTADVTRAKPAADVLMVDPNPLKAAPDDSPMPLMALQRYGSGEVLFLGTDNMWRWRKNSGDFHHTIFWGQIVQRMAGKRLLGGSRRSRLETDRRIYQSGDRISVFGRLFTRTWERLSEPFVNATLVSLSDSAASKEIRLDALPKQEGFYRTEFAAPEEAGRYRLSLDGDAAATLVFTVGSPGRELADPALNEPLLKELAQSTGGRFFREEHLHRLPESVRRRQVTLPTVMEVELWSSPFYFALLLSIVTAEWVVRKMSELK